MQKSTEFSHFFLRSIPGTIWAIGISSMLINVATCVVFSGSALYLKTVLGTAVSTIGFLEAIVEAIAYGVRIFSGVISDYFKKRKTLMVVGFVMLTISKPLLAFSKTLVGIFVARTVDRIGNGIQASPRDALVSDVSPKPIKGACFGLRQSLAVVGSTLGGLFGIIVMKLTHNNFELLFLLAAIPATVAVVILILFVREKRNNTHTSREANPVKDRRKIKFADMKLLGKRFWLLMCIVAVFMLGRFSEVFIALHACGNFGLDLGYGTSISMIYNLLSTLVAYPIGKLSDKIERTKLLMLGFGVLFISHLSIGYAASLSFVFIGTVLWGIQRGITEGLLATLVSDYVPKDLRGTGFGVYYLVVSLSTALASLVAGTVAQRNGEGFSFVLGAGFCMFAILLLFSFRKFLVAKTNKNFQ